MDKQEIEKVEEMAEDSVRELMSAQLLPDPPEYAIHRTPDGDEDYDHGYSLDYRDVLVAHFLSRYDEYQELVEAFNDTSDRMKAKIIQDILSL